MSIIEAFKLSGLNTEVITRHCKKIFDYDPVGLEYNYIIVYCACDKGKFSGLWEEYKTKVQEIDFGSYPIKRDGEGKPKLHDIRTKYIEIRVARATHIREGKETGIYHIFIHLN